MTSTHEYSCDDDDAESLQLQLIGLIVAPIAVWLTDYNEFLKLKDQIDAAFTDCIDQEGRKRRTEGERGVKRDDFSICIHKETFSIKMYLNDQPDRPRPALPFLHQTVSPAPSDHKGS